ncbi:hypothetical protein JZ751_003952 [Albula glossodonta]|uniref:Uncharacterized protein n=1 Tax=Albula glossodonta TaxID=121402 RepID=A0A8T2P5U5_9TELE|nr:hypothetical protein JZ751_003952 [Albula glossodonta]
MVLRSDGLVPRQGRAAKGRMERVREREEKKHGKKFSFALSLPHSTLLRGQCGGIPGHKDSGEGGGWGGGVGVGWGEGSLVRALLRDCLLTADGMGAAHAQEGQ